MVLDVPPKYFELDIESSAEWNDATNDSTPSGQSSVTLLPLSSKYEIFSNFGEKDCGEPSKFQHIVLDFTPDPEIDNDEAQNKCCKFWDFINSKSYLKPLRVEPIQEQGAAKPITVYDNDLNQNIEAINFITHDPNGFVQLSLESKIAGSKCSMDGSYSVADPLIKKSTPKPPVCICSKICTKCNKTKPSSSKNVQVKRMCKDLDDWDKQHPKSMKPPGPVMQYMPALQRKTPPAQDPKTCFD